MMSEMLPYVMPLFVGVLLGIVITIVSRWLVEGLRGLSYARRRRRVDAARARWRSAEMAPLYELGGTAAARPRTPRSVQEFLDGPRNRPDFNPIPGPRDW